MRTIPPKGRNRTPGHIFMLDNHNDYLPWPPWAM